MQWIIHTHTYIYNNETFLKQDDVCMWLSSNLEANVSGVKSINSSVIHETDSVNSPDVRDSYDYGVTPYHVLPYHTVIFHQTTLIGTEETFIKNVLDILKRTLQKSINRSMWYGSVHSV